LRARFFARLFFSNASGSSITRRASRHHVGTTDGMANGFARARAEIDDVRRLTSARVVNSHSSFCTQHRCANGNIREDHNARRNAEQPSDEISHPDSPSSDEMQAATISSPKSPCARLPMSSCATDCLPINQRPDLLQKLSQK
jgi:hypothetical protein